MIFYHSEFFSSFALDLKNSVALKFFTALNILFTFRMFEQELPGIFHFIEIFLSFKNFKQFALALKTEFTLKFLNPWGWVARPPDHPPRTPVLLWTAARSEFTKLVRWPLVSDK